MGLVPKYYYLLAADTGQVSIYFSLSKIKLINIDFLSSKLSPTYRVNDNHYRSVHITVYSACGFQNKLVSSFFKRVRKYILFLAKLKGEGRLFWNGKA